MDKLKAKLEQIIDFDLRDVNTIWNDEEINKIEEKYNIKFPNDYKYYLKNYGNDYIKEDYRLSPPVEIEQIQNISQFEIDSLYGLNNDENNLENKIFSYKEILPDNFIPIADLPGGDLICMGEEYKIYIWFHDIEGENIFLVSNSFKEFIFNINRIKNEESNINNVKLNLGNKLNAFLNKASNKK
ncbi:SMI1/KNR4 family protein [Sutcliffiella horikoshii]|uniref:SMI1/KNR4 family protein n=1 Tax=Sutcliffiella horikoshii TaxID=79883 RepID=A0AA94WRG9_9BACI|nr:SMI1/KNR4 family protein [Sutcliffiella horikoshii]TYS59877.1 SMI1/KNR4 family protein [Sutcliffiella horikoshii]